MDIYLDATETARRAGDHLAFASLANIYADAAWQTGVPEHWDQAVSLMDEASELPAAPGERAGMAANRIAHDLIRGEDVTDALDEAERLQEQDPDPRNAELPNALRADAALAAGRLDEAISLGLGVMERDVMTGGYASFAVVTAAILTGNREALASVECGERRRSVPRDILGGGQDPGSGRARRTRGKIRRRGGGIQRGA